MKKLPECRSPDSNIQIFPYLLSNSSNGFMFNESDNLTIVDCQAKCLNNCSCIAYASTNEDGDAGYEIWSTWPEDIKVLVIILFLSDGQYTILNHQVSLLHTQFIALMYIIYMYIQ